MQKTAILIALVLCTASRASSQQPTREPTCVIDGVPRPGIPCGPGQPNGDPLARYLFPPELVMANQQAIGLTDRQRSSL
ncbi:MAG: hypothetical protein ACJ791_09890, partial [Gemmatimonadaceae bacterium]